MFFCWHWRVCTCVCHGGSKAPWQKEVYEWDECCTVSAEAASSWPGKLCVNGLLLPVLRTVGLGHRRDPGVVSNRGVHWPLAGAHVAEGGVQTGALAGCVAVVGVGPPLVVWIVILCSCDGGVRGRAVVLQVEGPIGDVLRGALLLAVVAWAQLLCLDLGGSLLTLLALLSSSTQGGQRVLLGHPSMSPHIGCLADWGTADAIAAGVTSLGCSGHPSVAVWWQVLVKLVDIKAPHVGDDLAAQLTNVYSSKVDVELATGAFLHGASLALQVSFTGGKVCLGSGWGCRWALGLT